MMMREGVRGGQGPRRWWIVREIKEILRLVRLEEEGSVVLAEEIGRASCRERVS